MRRIAASLLVSLFLAFVHPSPGLATPLDPWFASGYTSQQITGSVAAVADLNEDGRGDLITTTRVYLTQPNGTFLQFGTITGSTSIPLVVDYDGDSHLDLIWPGTSSDTTVSLWKGNGTGALNRIVLATGQQLGEADLGDLNEDGYLDIAFPKLGADVITILYGTANIAAPLRVNLPTGNAPRGVAIADLTGDGHLDLVATCSQNGSSGGYVSSHYGDGTGNFAPRVDRSSRTGYRIQAHDCSGDGLADLVFRDQGTTVSYLVNQGVGIFGPEVNFSYVSAVEVVDLYPDADWEFVMSPYQLSGYYPSSTMPGMQIYNGGAVVTESVALGSMSRVVCGDVDGDRQPDILIGAGDLVLTFLNRGPGQWKHPDYHPLTTSAYANRSVFTDLNADGRLDFVAGSSEGFDLAIAAENGGFFTYPDYPGRILAGDVSLGGFDAGDLDGDGLADIVLSTSTDCYHCYKYGLRIAWARNGWQGYTNEIPVPAVTVTTGDATGDGHRDVIALIRDNVSGFYLISVLPGDGAGNLGAEIRSPATEGQVSVGPLVAVDLNGDGVLDLVTGNGTHLGLGNGQFGSRIGWEAPASDYLEIAIADLNWDGKLDVIGGSFSGPAGVTTRLGRGDGSFQLGTIITGYAHSPIAAGDLNGDGYPDLTIGTSPTSVFLANGLGGYTFEGTYGGTYNNVALSDVTNDGRLDIVSTHAYLPNLKPIVDVYPPVAKLLFPNGGGIVASESPLTIQWSAKDGVGVQKVDLFLVHLPGGAATPIAQGLSAIGSLDWTPGVANAGLAKVRAVVTDLSGNQSSDESDASFSIAGPPVAVDAVTAPLELALRVSPNPFKGRGRIELDLPGPTPVRMTVHDVSGRLVEVIEDEFVATARHSQEWRASGFAPGVYFVRLDTRFGALTRRIVLFP